VASRAAKERCDAGYGVGSGQAVYLDFKDSINRLGEKVIAERYGNLFQMYEKIVDENPYKTPMMIYPAIHYTMGGLWVDYELQTTVPGLFAIGEANFSDHGANRLGASALMQGLADGYFVLPFTIQNYLASQLSVPRMDPAKQPEFAAAAEGVRQWNSKLMGIKGARSVDSFHKELGLAMWDHVGMGRNKTGLEEGIAKLGKVKESFWNDVRIPGSADNMNPELEKANRVADFLELGELLAKDALHREESCGGHFREEHQMSDGEAKRDDENFKYVAAWMSGGPGKEPVLVKEPLDYEFIQVKTRNYKE
jgi:succinate dehydrogenase / fumarate reductase flavoprotein subunit